MKRCDDVGVERYAGESRGEVRASSIRVINADQPHAGSELNALVRKDLDARALQPSRGVRKNPMLPVAKRHKDSERCAHLAKHRYHSLKTAPATETVTCDNDEVRCFRRKAFERRALESSKGADVKV